MRKQSKSCRGWKGNAGLLRKTNEAREIIKHNCGQPLYSPAIRR